MKTAIITGASRGIGQACALDLARQGFHLALFARSLEHLEKTREACLLKNPEIEIVLSAVDVREDDALVSAIHAALRQWSGQIDVLINNAGGGSHGTLDQISLSSIRWTLDTTLWGTIVGTHTVIPAMVKRGEGTIINICSIAGRMGMAKSSAYCAAKFGVLGFTESVFEDVRQHGIKVSAICPGMVNTNLIPNVRHLNREKMIQPEAVVQAVNYIIQSDPSCCPTELVLRPSQTPYA